MKLSQLSNFLNEAISFAELKKSIEVEINSYKIQLSKPSANANVNVQEDKEIILTDKYLSVLCQTYLRGEMENHEMYYIVDALQLSEYVQFSDQKLRAKFDCLTDPEINYGELSPQIVRSILNS